jgi:hypothetical protein
MAAQNKDKKMERKNLRLNHAVQIRNSLKAWVRVLPFACLFFAGSLNAWELAKVDKVNGIEIYTRHVLDSDFKAYRGTMRIKTSLLSLVALVDDISSCPLWIDTCVEGRLLKRISPAETYTYTINNAPWPVSDRDAVVHNRISQNPETRRVTIHIKGEPDYIPPKKGLVRVKMIEGFWEFMPMGNGIVEVVYQVHNDPGGGLPPWIVNSVVVTQPYNTLLNMKKMVVRQKYQAAHYDFIKE